MAILSKKEKLKLVRRYIGGQYVPAPEAFRSRTSFKASLLNWVKRYRLCGRREGEGSPVPQRPGLAVPEEGVRGHPGGIRDGPVDVAEGQLPRQLGHGELLRAAEGRDVLRRGGTLQRLRKPEEGPRGLHRMVQLKPAERVPPLEVASGGSFQFRYSLITYRYSVQVSRYRTFQPIIHLERFGRKTVFLFWKNIGRSISFPRYPWQTFLFPYFRSWHR